ncbi:thioesterase [Terasakiispira papahanaumokuakeensis]|uniref:Thioesterase n=1 Tax=Terasakiispira papahanaumokuakeensis TaxID=197479 RepID=A0A1E2V9E4_9GAMM|nr:thioesterase [Terasakiispira papahanaumokuakeensis]
MSSHAIEIKVRGYHLDIYGHVNNARYLEFLEEARWAFIEAQGGLEELTRSGLGMAAVNININYRRPAWVNEVLSIRTGLRRVGSKSAVLHQDVVLAHDETPVADADVTFVLIDVKRHQTVELDEGLRKQFAQWPEL